MVPLTSLVLVVASRETSTWSVQIWFTRTEAWRKRTRLERHRDLTSLGKTITHLLAAHQRRMRKKIFVHDWTSI